MKNLFLFLTLTAFSVLAISQELKINWIPLEKIDERKSIVFNKMEGYNSKYFYALFCGPYQTEGAYIAAMDKSTFKVQAKFKFYDPKNKEREKLLEDMGGYMRTFCFENSIILLWQKYVKDKDKEKDKMEYYFESFTSDLKPIKPLTKVCEIPYKRTNIMSAYLPCRFFFSNKESESILISIIAPVGDTADKFDYALLKSDFTLTATKNFSQPVGIFSKDENDYILDNAGKLHFHAVTEISEKKAKPVDGVRQFPVYSTIDLVPGVLNNYPIKSGNMNVTDFRFSVNKNNILLVGLFSDISRSAKGEEGHGIFYKQWNEEAFSIGPADYIYFTKEQMQKAFKDSKNLKQNYKENGTLPSNYIIDDIRIKDNNTVLFCSGKKYTSSSYESSIGMTKFSFGYEKIDITAFKVSSENKILWVSNVGRYTSLPASWTNDLKIRSINNSFFVLFGHGNKHIWQEVFNYDSGEYKDYHYEIDDAIAKRLEVKVKFADNVQLVDNVFYTYWEGFFGIIEPQIK